MIRNLAFLITASSFLLIIVSCNKSIDDFPSIPPQTNTDTSSYIQFTISGIQPGGYQHYALLSIDSKAGQPAIVNKKVALDHAQGSFKTDKIKIGKGDFKLTKFIILKASDTATYATPRSGTPKASEVEKPLVLDFAVSSRGINSKDVQVLKIAASDAPLNYGYTPDDFGFIPYVNVRVKLKINVGAVAYDSMPGKLNIEAINSEGATWLRELDMPRGLTTISVPADFTTFKFKIAKWNTIAQKQLNRVELQSNTIVALESSRQPKKLKQETAYIENVAGFIPDSRTEYIYNGGLLNDIKYYQRSPQVSGLPLTIIYKFKYNGAKLDSINRFDSNTALTGYTAFFYNGNRISNISNKSYDQHTGVAIEYLVAGNNEAIEFDYLFSNGNSMFYRMVVTGGNKTSDYAYTSTGAGESGTYEYDDNINPKHQLGYPDLYFSNSSMNNLVKEQKNYGGSIASVIPYKFEYIYDNDGYPSEAYISYRGATSQQHLYRIKKVYTYH